MSRGMLAVGLLVLLAGCGGAPRGDAARGQALFGDGELGDAGRRPSCLSCHSVTPGDPPAVGPNLAGIGGRAASTVPGQSGPDYLRAAIVEPDAFLAGGFQEGIHPRDYGQLLSAQQLADLVAYMETLQSE